MLEDKEHAPAIQKANQGLRMVGKIYCYKISLALEIRKLMHITQQFSLYLLIFCQYFVRYLVILSKEKKRKEKKGRKKKREKKGKERKRKGREKKGKEEKRREKKKVPMQRFINNLKYL